MNRQCHSKGQLLLPMLALLVLMALFILGYLQFCRQKYWKMRMDIAARATALSAARTQAELLNTMATTQLAENLFLQKAEVPALHENVGHMQIAARPDFEALNNSLQAVAFSFRIQVLRVAKLIATANGSNRTPVPMGILNHWLEPKDVHVFYFHTLIPAGYRHYKTAYFVRGWEPHKMNAQPAHRLGWTVCHDNVCETAMARLWLDVTPDSTMSNGGFPRDVETPWRGAGIQCWYPQFNARLMARGHYE